MGDKLVRERRNERLRKDGKGVFMGDYASFQVFQSSSLSFFDSLDSK